MMDLVRAKDVKMIVIDDNQIQYNRLMDIFEANNYTVHAVLLDDLLSLQKHIKKTWDIIFYSKAYDFDQEKLFDLIKSSKQPYLPCLRLEHKDTAQNHYALNSDFFDQVNINHPKHLSFTFRKAIEVSYLWQEKQRLDKDVETIQNQVKTTSEHMQDASMIVQEGIVMETNQHFHDMFQIEDAFGLPLLDVLQPKDLEHFKQQFKLIDINSAQTYQLDIESINPVLKHKNLNIKIFSDQEEESLHISVSQQQTVAETVTTTLKHYEQINQIISKQSSSINQNILLSFTIDLSHTDSKVVSDPKHVGQYLKNAVKHIKNHTTQDIIPIGPFDWVGIMKNTAPMTALQVKEQLNQGLKQSSIPFQLGYCILDGKLNSEDHFYALYAQSKEKNLSTSSGLEQATTQTAAIPKEQFTADSHQNPSFTVQPAVEPPSIETIVPPVAEFVTPAPQTLSEMPVHDMISPPNHDTFTANSGYQTSVKYQQVYDKNDANPHMFEATTNFVDMNGISYNLNYSEGLPLIDPSSLIKIDQETIQTACLNLHQFCQTTPDANIIINLHHTSLESPLAAYLAAILQKIPGLNANKIIVQFNALDIISLNLQGHPTWNLLKQLNIGIGLRHFNFNTKKVSLLQQIQPKICFMALNLGQILSNNTQHQYIQEQFNHFNYTDFVIPELNDMNDFADAWNVDCRYLQGQYFQDKLDHMTNI